VVEFGRDGVVPPGGVKREVVVVRGQALIDGTVEDNVLVVSGGARVAGEIRGDLLVIGGSARLESGAAVGGHVFVLGGGLEQAETATVGGHRFVLPWHVNWAVLAPLGDWTRSGLFVGRPVVPHLSWNWWVGGAFGAFYLVLALLFPRVVMASADVLRLQPAGSTLSGFLLCLLLGPLAFLLIISVAGILILPLILAAVVMAVCFGKAGVCALVGEQLTGRRGGMFLALLLGAAALFILYMVPVVGFLVWGMATLVGLGAAVLAALNALGWENRVEDRDGPSGAALSGDPTGVADRNVLGSAIQHPLWRVGFWRRLWASVIDMTLLGVLLALGGPFLLVIWIAYHVGFWVWLGSTIGGIIVGIKVVRVDGAPVDFSTALVRSLASVFSALPLFLGFLWAGWDPERQAWHDRIAGTVVVRTRRPRP
jgi:RDD family